VIIKRANRTSEKIKEPNDSDHPSIGVTAQFGEYENPPANPVEAKQSGANPGFFPNT
jgi:hypothetical protein